MADTGPGGIIKSCVRTQAAGEPAKIGSIRISDGPGLVFQVQPPPCNPTIETELDWPSVQGGGTGATGPTGASGPTGPTGARGPTRPGGGFPGSVIVPGEAVQAGLNPSPGTQLTATATCPSGLLLGGGGTVTVNGPTLARPVAVYESYPSATATWTIGGIVLGRVGGA